MPADITGVKRGKYGFEFRGFKELGVQLSRSGEPWRRVRAAAARGMTEVTEDLLGRAMRDAPVDEATLRASGTAVVYVDGKPVSRAGTQAFAADTGEAVSRRALAGRAGEVGVRVEAGPLAAEGPLGDSVLGVVGFNMPYALAQHERLDYNHPKGGKAKYLEDNLTGQADRYVDHIGNRVGEALR